MTFWEVKSSRNTTIRQIKFPRNLTLENREIKSPIIVKIYPKTKTLCHCPYSSNGATYPAHFTKETLHLYSYLVKKQVYFAFSLVLRHNITSL